MKCVKKGENICSPLLNMTAMSDLFNKRCTGKDKCLIDNFDQFLLKNQNDKLDLKRCIDPTSRLFIQYMCKHSDQ